MKIIDCHSHTAFSGHGYGTVSEAVASAQRKGLALYAQTEHLTLPEQLDPTREDGMSPEDALLYQAQVRTEQERLASEGSDMELLLGIEADWLTGRAAELETLCKPYDYVIGSIHFLNNLPLDNSDNLELWDTLGVDGVWETYLNAMEDMIRHSGPIRCLGHLDLPKVFGWRPSFDLREPFGDLASLVAQRDLIIEVNCAGWFKKAEEQYPALDILKIYQQAGVACTVGCDAHKPENIAVGVEDAYRLMYEAGYRSVAAPSAHDMRSIPFA